MSIDVANDLEIGLFRTSSTSSTHEQRADSSSHISSLSGEQHGHSLHEVIGDALELFSRHLRARE